jgi:hypothetical protein
MLSADMIFGRLAMGESPPYKPAFFSYGSFSTHLYGHSDDPWAEDANRLEFDVLKISGAETMALIAKIQSLTTPLRSYDVQPLIVDHRQALKIRNIENDGKYYGLELILVSESSRDAGDAFAFFNRARDSEFSEDNTDFRLGVDHFLQSVHLDQCPTSWNML